jgi:hypothetical protein
MASELKALDGDGTVYDRPQLRVERCLLIERFVERSSRRQKIERRLLPARKQNRCEHGVVVHHGDERRCVVDAISFAAVGVDGE